jgi:HPt (histidine-containing phosphotransfer) domain-containing protein
MSDETLDMSIVAVLQRIKKVGFFPNLVDVFEEDSKRLLGVIKENIEAGETKALEESAHSLKSASSSIGAARVAEIASDLEQLGESGTVDGAAEKWSELNQRLTVAHKAFRDLLVPG